ncbi:mucin-4-like isoform X2 [Musca domestica]|uniref:Mucin-4-like isoform X2 n=1 Tax=Musca domestica TaxID=7370 RepID=A0ABM3V412_MUSDO|nr:mucin-4-like isoform X2 [Musca domestica]
MRGNIKMSRNWMALMVIGLLASQMTVALNIATTTTRTPTPVASQIPEDGNGAATATPSLTRSSSTSSLNDNGKADDLHFTPSTAGTLSSHESVVIEAKQDVARRTTEASIPSTPLQSALAETHTPTLASSNAPATTILNEGEQSRTTTTTTTIKTLRKVTTMAGPPENAQRKEDTNKASLEGAVALADVDVEKGQQQITTMTEQQTIIKQKQPEEQQQQHYQPHEEQQKQQTLTTEVSMLKETEVQQQVNGNAQTTTANVHNNVITLKATATDNNGVGEDEKVMEEKLEVDNKFPTTTTNLPFTTIAGVGGEEDEMADKTEIVNDSQQFKADTSSSSSGNIPPSSLKPQEENLNLDEYSRSGGNLRDLNKDEGSTPPLPYLSSVAENQKSLETSREAQHSLDGLKPLFEEARNLRSVEIPESLKIAKQQQFSLGNLKQETPEARNSKFSSPSNSEKPGSLETSNEQRLSSPEVSYSKVAVISSSEKQDSLKTSRENQPSLIQESSLPRPSLSSPLSSTDRLDYTKSSIEPEQELSPNNLKPQNPETSNPKSIPTTSENQESLKIFEGQQLSLDDFKPLIQEANNKLLAERTIFTPKNVIEEQEWKQNLMPNEVEDYDHPEKHNGELKKFHQAPYEHNINWSPYLHPATPVAVDFTGKVLQEEDGVITEIEEKFRLKEFATDINDKKDMEEFTTMEAGEQSATATTTSKPSQETPVPSTHKPYATLLVNHEKSPPNTHRSQDLAAGAPHNMRIMRPVEFIERRVKKSFDFPMHRIASDADHAMQHFDFANTKFSSNLNEPKQHLNPPIAGAQETPSTGGGGAAVSLGAGPNQGHDMNAMHVPRQQPEFSTTKFYNSKELYNEMLQHKNKQQQQQQQLHTEPDSLNMLKEEDIAPGARAGSSLTLNSFAVLHSPKIAKLEEIHEQPQKSLAIKRVTVQQSARPHNKDEMGEASSTPKINVELLTATTTAASASTTTTTTKKFHKELKKAKLLIKTMLPSSSSNNNNNNNEDATQKTETSKSSTATPEDHSPGKTKPTTTWSSAAATTTTTAILTTNPTTLTSSRPQESRSNNLTSSLSSATSSSTSTPAEQSSSDPASSSPSVLVPSYIYPPPTWRPTASHSTNPTKSAMKPIVRPRILSRLQEKINSLECEIPNVPQDSHLWRGNETHELLLPIMTPENCKTDKDCTAMMVSWEGEAEIQSGDILIVEINDALLNPKEVNLTTSAHNTQVYQVTRSGHEHCDVTEGILLDITPLIVDGRKLVTLYDKDLTEGVNLLIVVSELWGSQCVRLKVTTKTENCGEGADCSGKGVCFSDSDMEEYECQCCSGFAGPHCEEIDACTPSPCTNNGICVDLSQGHEGNSYQCLCPYGYTGKNCQYELDPCNPAECMNGGSCVGNSTHFRCECAPGFTGPLCQHILNECESSPCIHGICVDQEDGFRCFCQPGFAGELCNFEYNECESNPCQNGGECIDHIGSYECRCSKGYTGTRCHIKVDFCASKPCPEGRRCIDHGNDYSCECLGGRNGPDCNEMLRTQCNVNPCTHGGTCWSSGDSFYCACRPGYTGTMCEDEFVVETVVSSSEFMVDDTSARNFNDKSFGSSVVLKSPIELHNAYTAAIVLALVIFFVALYLTICHCKVNQTYRKFSTRTYGFLPILGFRWRTKQATSKISRHWLSGKGLGGGGATGANAMRVATNSTLSAPLQRNSVGHLPTANASATAAAGSSSSAGQQQRHHHVGQLNERPFQRHLAMNLENDMYYTVDFSENSQHSPLIQ